MLLRFEETAIGALKGAVGAGFILPSSTHGIAQGALVRLLRSTSEVLERLSHRPHIANGRESIQYVRTLDRDLSLLRNLAQPYTGRITLLKSPLLMGLIHDASALTHYARTLAVALIRNPGDARTREACSELSRHIAALAGDLATRKKSAPGLTFRSRALTVLPAPPAGKDGTEHQIARAEQFLQSLAGSISGT